MRLNGIYQDRLRSDELVRNLFNLAIGLLTTLRAQRLKRFLEDRNLLKLRSLDSSSPFFLSDNSLWGQ